MSAATFANYTTNYTAPVYIPPVLLEFVGGLLEIPRESRNTSFAIFFSKDEEDRNAQGLYIESLFGLASCIIALVFFWFACLMILSCKDRNEVGCATGRGFDKVPSMFLSWNRFVEEYFPPTGSESGRRQAQEDDDDENSSGVTTIVAFPRTSTAPTTTTTRNNGRGGGGRRRESFHDELEEEEERQLQAALAASRAEGLGYPPPIPPPSSSPSAPIAIAIASPARRSRTAPSSSLYSTPPFPQVKTLAALDMYETASETSRSFTASYDGSGEMIGRTYNNNNNNNNNNGTNTTTPIGVEAINDEGDSTCFICCSSHPYHVQIRRRRTRMTYFFFSLLSICGCLLLLFQVSYPLDEASVDMADILVESHTVVDQVQQTLDVMEGAAGVAEQVITTIPFDFTVLCPNVPPELISTELAVNPQDVIVFLQEEFATFLESTAFYMEEIQDMTWKIKVGLIEAGSSVKDGHDNLWFISLWVGIMVALTVSSLVGVVMAICKERQEAAMEDAENGDAEAFLVSGGGRSSYPMTITRFEESSRGERMQSCLVLPLLIAFTIIGWFLIVMACVTTVVTKDACVSESTGSPEGTIREVLEAYGLNSTQTTYRTIVAYTEGCQEEDPIQDIRALQDLLSENLKIMRDRLAEADYVGYGVMEEQCGEGNQITAFFSGINSMAGQLALVEDSLMKVTDALSCPNVNSLYTRSVHDVVCTDVAGASAYGFVLLFGVCFSSMILITLRSSWRHSRGMV